MLEKTDDKHVSIEKTVTLLLAKDGLTPDIKITELISADVFVDNVLELLVSECLSEPVVTVLEYQLRQHWQKFSKYSVRSYLLAITTVNPTLMYNVHIALGNGLNRAPAIIADVVDCYELALNRVFTLPRDLLHNTLQSLVNTAYQVLKGKSEVTVVKEDDVNLLYVSQYYGESYVDGGRFTNDVSSNWYSSREDLSPTQVEELEDKIHIKWISSSDDC